MSNGTVPNPSPTPKASSWVHKLDGIELTKAEWEFICGMADEINSASAQNGVSTGIIAGILLDENRRYDFFDGLQDIEADFLILYEGWLEDLETFLWENTTGEDLLDTSFGQAQMNLGTIQDLIENGYLDEPDGWDDEDNRQDILLQLAENESRAAELVAARLKQTIDHWNAGGVDISNLDDILGTLYSLGLTGASGVNDDPQPNERGTTIAEYADALSDLLLEGCAQGWDAYQEAANNE